MTLHVDWRPAFPISSFLVAFFGIISTATAFGAICAALFAVLCIAAFMCACAVVGDAYHTGQNFALQRIKEEVEKQIITAAEADADKIADELIAAQTTNHKEARH